MYPETPVAEIHIEVAKGCIAAAADTDSGDISAADRPLRIYDWVIIIFLGSVCITQWDAV